MRGNPVIVGYDGSEESLAAARWAIAHAQGRALVAVVALGDATEAPAETVDRMNERWSRDDEMFGDHAQMVFEPGAVPEALCRVATRFDADMIVLGHRRARDGDSVARELLDLADRPVTVVR